MKANFSGMGPIYYPYWIRRRDSIWNWFDRQRQRAALARLEDRMLDDIGVTRAEALAECQRHD